MHSILIYHCTSVLVPSRAPTNVQVENHGLNELLVKWDPIPQQYVNGRLQGYKVFYKNTRYYYNPEIIVNTSNSDITQVILPNIQTGERYQISVAGFTPRGQGPRSSYLYITKGEYHLNRAAINDIFYCVNMK